MAIVLEADKDGFLTWNRRPGITSKVFCPYNKKMQCNLDCPMFIIADDNNVKFACSGGSNISCPNAKVFGPCKTEKNKQ